MEDENGNKKEAVSSADAGTVSENLDKAAESATEEDKLEEDTAAPAEDPESQSIKITVKNGDKAVNDVVVVLSKDGAEDKKATTVNGVAVFESPVPKEEMIEIQKEAYLRAMREAHKII